jgi:hypothetical protein
MHGIIPAAKSQYMTLPRTVFRVIHLNSIVYTSADYKVWVMKHYIAFAVWACAAYKVIMWQS